MYDYSSESTKFREGRYTVSLSWKQFHPPLPDNYHLSQQRLMGLGAFEMATSEPCAHAKL